ncbi:MAG: OsmC family peroxiredoxin [Pedobacter sp.]|nr:MAG: OsmC family peroxiredoxin [Pedobacter sp.]
MKRNATAIWNGTGKDGKGVLTTQSGTLSNTQYSFKSRFEEGIGTNPEELVAAAHSGCFSMKLSFNISAENITPEEIITKAIVNLDPEKGEITAIHLECEVKAPGLSKEKFDELVADAKANCPISKLMKAEITVEATLADQ